MQKLRLYCTAVPYLSWHKATTANLAEHWQHDGESLSWCIFESQLFLHAGNDRMFCENASWHILSPWKFDRYWVLHEVTITHGVQIWQHDGEILSWHFVEVKVLSDSWLIWKYYGEPLSLRVVLALQVSCGEHAEDILAFINCIGICDAS